MSDGSPTAVEVAASGEGPGLTRAERLTVIGGVFGVLPILFCGIRILTVSDRDIETLRMLVQNLDVKALVLATVLPVAGTVAFWSQFLLYASAFSPQALSNARARGGRNAAAVWFLLLLPFTMVLLFTAMPTRQWTVNGAIFAAFVVLVIVARVRRSIARHAAVLALLMFFAAIVAGVVTIVFDGGMWLPKEELTMFSGSRFTGYVLSTDGTWTRYMDLDHKIHVVPTTAIAFRGVVSDEG